MAAAEESQLYNDLMRFKPEGLTPNGWAVMAGVSRTVWADMRRHGNPSRRTLAKLLAAAESSLAEFEALRIGGESNLLVNPGALASVGDAAAPSWKPAPLAPVPLLLTSMAGEWGEPGKRVEMTELEPNQIVERIRRPDSLSADRDAYALTIVGDSMWPRFRPGRRVIVSPRAPVAIGDDVVVQLRSSQDSEQKVVRVLIKEMLRRTANFVELRQFNPDVSFRVEASEIAVIHKIMGEVF